MRKINFLVIHCSATRENVPFHASDIDRWHKAKGYNGIGYHYVITLDGVVENGRPEEQIGAHVSGHNKDSIGVCYIGGCDENMQAKDTRTNKQKVALINLLIKLQVRYPDAIILGHRDFPKVAKACPSFDAKKEYSWITKEYGDE